MSSLYNISDEYINIMSEIEELEGEITPELEERLKINQEELEHKIKAYHHIISINNGNNDSIDDEIQRLGKLKKTKENINKKLKERVVEALQLFGYDGKSGNKKLDFDILKCYTVNNKVVDVNEENFIEDSIISIDTPEKEENVFFKYSVSLELDWNQYHTFKSNITVPYIMNTKIDKKHIKSLIEQGLHHDDCTILNKPYVKFS